MKTPICDFINKYASSQSLRLHMPGHKGKSQLGFEKYDITEIVGADSLYHANGIIKESEENATSLFESGKTLYSTEGSSHIIRAMLYLAKIHARKEDSYVLASRNAHSSFISACVLNDIDIEWLYGKDANNYLSCIITAEELEKALSCVDKMPICVYVTSPDYLGNMCDISSLASVCKNHGVPLVVDKDLHPISLGATMCCDSAHKTLPVLTGGAYLHISKDAPILFNEMAKDALSLFGSTSPSYLTLASLDNANKYIENGYREKLNLFVENIRSLFSDFSAFVSLNEPLKLVIEPKKIGYRGEDFAEILQNKGVICEFFDEDYVVLMLSVENGLDEMKKLASIIENVEKNQPICKIATPLIPPKKKMTVRQGAYAQKENIPLDWALGRVLASSCVSCPPAVSLIVCGEEFNESTVALCKKYGLTSFSVVKNK